MMSNTALLQRMRDPPQPSAPILACSKIGLCIIPVAQIAIGAVHLHDCPREPYIPVYLIVSGVFGLALAVLSCLPCARQAKDEPANPLSRVCTAWNSLTTSFLFCWFIAGNVWIYSIYEPNYNKNATSAGPYCDRTLYLFAFWTTTLVYILGGPLPPGQLLHPRLFLPAGPSRSRRQRLGVKHLHLWLYAGCNPSLHTNHDALYHTLELLIRSLFLCDLCH
ncbi:unnamed protein product [Tetraodon nigroviridis]|uniref:(spotted green pufferfish) hypothetical protein n=1 Tax=Tetraodon nigroviridis TaxID=99883 RepID=Q4SRN3_TETNG|nr:unnamed protein product [Tetraodon nigroviridis]